MKKVLNIISSVKGDDSFSIKLSNAVLEKIISIYPNSSIHTHDLSKSPFPHLEEAAFTSFYTPQEKRTEEHKEALLHSDEAIKELMEADILVLGVPLYNFGIPSTLKAWIDHVARSGVTFRYADGRPEGLVKNKKVYLAMASGGIYSDGPMKSYDFAEPYLRAVLGFIGLTDITTFRVEGTVIPGMKETALPKALSRVEEYAF